MLDEITYPTFHAPHTLSGVWLFIHAAIKVKPYK